MFLRILAILLGIAALSVTTISDKPLVIGVFAVVMLGYGFGGKRLLSKVAPTYVDARNPLDDLQSVPDLSPFKLFVLMLHHTMRNSWYMALSVIASVVIAWDYQFRFDVSRDEQRVMFPLVWLTAFFLLEVAGAVVGTFVVWRRRVHSRHVGHG